MLTNIGGLLAGSLGVVLAATVPAHAGEIDEIVIWGEAQDRRNGAVVALAPQDLASANVVTTEDLVKYEPSLIIRRRFIGDANGTMGMRGASMFQTSRSMVFADGVPLHYLLQTRWDGAPRWSMIAASEIDHIDILYGPFSAEYSGNAMGGVILMESRIPQKREFHFDSSVFVQDFSAYGFREALQGYKSFLSYGDRIGDLSLYMSYNRLENASQPQSFYMGSDAVSTKLQPVTGGIGGSNEHGLKGIFTGDSGVTDNVTDSLKLKLGYDLGVWSVLLNLAYESRVSDAMSANTYLRDEDGRPVWSGNVRQDGQALFMPASRSGISLGRRESLSSGLRVKGWLSDSVSMESNINWFSVLRDENRASAANPADPAYTLAGQVRDYGSTGWRTADIKLGFDLPSLERISLVTGLRHEQYQLAIDVFASEDYRLGQKSYYKARSGGETSLDSVFAQLHWDIGQRWEVGLGTRFESWRSRDGFFGNDRPGTPEFDVVYLPERASQKLSPKFSLGYLPDENWSVRYSLARAYRFAIVEELFSQYQAFNTVNTANPDLAPENGLHHNLAFERLFEQGVLKLNIYQESIENVIEAQAMILPGGISLRTFLPVTEVQTRGLELIANHQDVLFPGLDLRFNLAYTHADIVSNLTDPSIEGNRFPRMPEWRANLLLNYRLRPGLDVGAGIRYASNSFGRLDNRDRESEVFGAQDGYMFVNLKANWQVSANTQLGLGVDNLFNEVAYVTHPWPARTLFLEGRLSL